ncbi:hybrid sensor histidine kinase/response regulator [Viscerimonas tarda]
MKHFKNISILLTLYLILFSSQLLAIENLHFERISERDGLSQNTVRCAIQDKTGFMWFGTINGLNRYNGKEFNTIFPQSTNVTSLSDNRIRSLVEDDYGYIWIQTVAKTIDCYNPRTESFVDYAPEDKQKNYTKILNCSNGDIWLSRENGCCRIRHSGGKLQTLLLTEKELGSSSAPFLHEDAFGQIWIGTNAGVYRLDKNDRVVKVLDKLRTPWVFEVDYKLYFVNNDHILPFDLNTQKLLPPIAYPSGTINLINRVELLNNEVLLIASKTGMTGFNVKKKRFISSNELFNNDVPQNANIYTDNKGNKWVHNFSGNLWRQLPEGNFQKINLIPPQILAIIDAERYSVYQDTRNFIWITTYGNGLFVIDTSAGQMHHYTTHNSKLSSDYLLCITEDKSGEIWIGTEFAGISKISLSDYPVQVLYPNPNDVNDRDNSVRMIYQDTKGRFWLGTRSGNLHIYDSLFVRQQTHKIANGLPYCAGEDTKGNIWIGTRGDGLLVYPLSGSNAVRQYHLQDISKQDLTSDYVFDFTFDSKNRIWVASFGGGLHYADINAPEVKFRKILGPSRSRTIMHDHTGWIWSGSDNGVVAFNPDEVIRDESKYLHFQFDPNNGKSINNNEVKAIYEDSRGRIWFGTTGGGLNLLVREKPIERSWFKHYTSENGLSNEVIQSILEDSEGNIWVSTEGAISKFDPQTERFENFSFSEEEQARIFNTESCYRTQNGKLMFGNYSGVYIFQPEEIKYDAYTPPVVISGLKINGATIRPEEDDSPLAQSITQTKSIRLKYNQNSFNIEFAMLNFQSSEFNQYTYYMEGYEKKWNPVTRYNIGTYRNIPPGTYRFKVKGSNSFGIWTEEETVLEIEIMPPFWKSVWAYLIYTVLLAMAIFFAIKVMLHIHRLHTAVKVEQQLTEYKLRFFTNISHEFRTPLTIIRGAIDSLNETGNLPAPAIKLVGQLQKSSSRLLRLIDQLLEFRKLQNKGLELEVERTEVIGFFRDITQTFKEVTDKKNIRLLFVSDLSAHEQLLDVNKFDKIMYNLLSNAVKHTPGNGVILVKVMFSAQDDKMTLSVADSGPGVPKDKRGSLFVRFAQMSNVQGGTGIGLHLTAELAAVHKGTVEYSDSELGGACFSVSVPLSNANYSKKEIITPQASIQTNAGIDNEETITGNEEALNIDSRFSNYKILIIEDEDDVREFIISQLGLHFNVFPAKNGTEGLEKASLEQPDLIVCDVMMPGISGFEVTRTLKDNFLTSHIPVILLTAHSSEEHRLEGIQTGADSYITKPFSTKYLLLRIVKLIEQREKLRQKFAEEPGVTNQLLTFTDKDKELLEKVNRLIEKNMGNTDFSVVDMFTQATRMRRTSFYEKLKGITGCAPNEYLRTMRMKKAAELLATTDLNISEISYQVGFNDSLYFSKCFKAQFGKAPSEYRKGG